MKNMFSKGAHPSEFGHRQTTMLMLGLFYSFPNACLLRAE